MSSWVRVWLFAMDNPPKKPKEFSNTRSALLSSIKSDEICCAEGKFSNILCPKYHAGEKGFCPEIK